MARILPAVVLLLLFGCLKSYAIPITITWDAAQCVDPCVNSVDGYIVYTADSEVNIPAGTQIDVGDVLTADIDIPDGYWIAVTAYNIDGESGFSNFVQYTQDVGPIQPSTGGTITLVLLDQPDPTGRTEHGDGYEVIFSQGKVIIIHDNLDAGDTVRLGF